MGIIDPMVIGNAAATGVLEFSNWPVLWALTVGLLSAAMATVALSGSQTRRLAGPALAKLHHAQLATAGLGRVK
jgi:hypothetical protein